MPVSVFDLFKIGIGPSSSHTVGPMRAARMFAAGLEEKQLAELSSVRVELFGSLGATGHGHGTPKAVILGLMGEHPESVDPEVADAVVDAVHESGVLVVLGCHAIRYDEEKHLVMRGRDRLPGHPNGMRFTAFDAAGLPLTSGEYYSVGGGFVVAGEDLSNLDDRAAADVEFPFRSAEELLAMCRETGFDISEIVMRNELGLRARETVLEHLFAVGTVMRDCAESGCAHEGELPGGRRVKRRALSLRRSLEAASSRETSAMQDLEWVTLWALAVNEENAAGSRVVTAPTNGAAGVVPAVLHYYQRFVPGSDADGVARFLLTAAAIGGLCKENASISGAEVGCQGEIGSACAMAAAGLTAVLGGTPEQVENAAEIGIEHNLGLTCDPVGGLVQIPCIERNALAAIKAIAAARLALRGDGEHRVSLDRVIATMRETGNDMKKKYKETSRGGLAVNVSEC